MPDEFLLKGPFIDVDEPWLFLRSDLISRVMGGVLSFYLSLICFLLKKSLFDVFKFVSSIFSNF